MIFQVLTFINCTMLYIRFRYHDEIIQMLYPLTPQPLLFYILTH